MSRWKAELLLSHGKGRNFRPGQHVELLENLARHCPLQKCEQTEEVADHDSLNESTYKLASIILHQRALSQRQGLPPHIREEALSDENFYASSEVVEEREALFQSGRLDTETRYLHVTETSGGAMLPSKNISTDASFVTPPHGSGGNASRMQATPCTSTAPSDCHLTPYEAYDNRPIKPLVSNPKTHFAQFSSQEMSGDAREKVSVPETGSETKKNSCASSRKQKVLQKHGKAPDALHDKRQRVLSASVKCSDAQIKNVKPDSSISTVRRSNCLRKQVIEKSEGALDTNKGSTAVSVAPSVSSTLRLQAFRTGKPRTADSQGLVGEEKKHLRRVRGISSMGDKKVVPNIGGKKSATVCTDPPLRISDVQRSNDLIQNVKDCFTGNSVPLVRDTDANNGSVDTLMSCKEHSLLVDYFYARYGALKVIRAATCIQAAWRGFRVRNMDVRVLRVKMLLLEKRQEDCRRETEFRLRRLREKVSRAYTHKGAKSSDCENSVSSDSRSGNGQVEHRICELEKRVMLLQHENRTLKARLGTGIDSSDMNVPPPVCELRVKVLKKTEVALRWTPAENIACRHYAEDGCGYRVYINDTPWELLSIDKTEHKISGLAPGRLYNFFVRTVVNDIESSDSVCVAVKLPKTLSKKKDSVLHDISLQDAEINASYCTDYSEEVGVDVRSALGDRVSTKMTVPEAWAEEVGGPLKVEDLRTTNGSTDDSSCSYEDAGVNEQFKMRMPGGGAKRSIDSISRDNTIKSGHRRSSSVDVKSTVESETEAGVTAELKSSAKRHYSALLGTDLPRTKEGFIAKLHRGFENTNSGGVAPQHDGSFNVIEGWSDSDRRIDSSRKLDCSQTSATDIPCPLSEESLGGQVSGRDFASDVKSCTALSEDASKLPRAASSDSLTPDFPSFLATPTESVPEPFIRPRAGSHSRIEGLTMRRGAPTDFAMTKISRVTPVKALHPAGTASDSTLSREADIESVAVSGSVPISIPGTRLVRASSDPSKIAADSPKTGVFNIGSPKTNPFHVGSPGGSFFPFPLNSPSCPVRSSRSPSPHRLCGVRNNVLFCSNSTEIQSSHA